VLITTTGVCSVSLGGSNSATIHMDSGTGTCVVHYNQTGNENYNAAPEETSNTTAKKVDPIFTVVGGTFTYDGNPHGGTATAKGVLNEELTPVNVAYKDSLGNLLTSAPVNAGSYSVAARFLGNDNYNPKQAAAEALTIDKALARLR